ncbi:MAG: hypothetical protein QM767_03735 [Anaeromyxobacter sp.]
MSALGANLEPSLGLLAEVVMAPTFPAADFERLKQQQLAAIAQEQSEPAIDLGAAILPRLVYGQGHAYANPLTGSGTTASSRS